MKDLKPGLSGVASTTVTKTKTAVEIGSGSVPVLATPMLVSLMECAAINSLGNRLEKGQTTVGIKIEISHTAATPVGVGVTAKAELVEVDRKRLVFEVSAEDDCGQIGSGCHERFIVEQDKFISKANEKM